MSAWYLVSIEIIFGLLSLVFFTKRKLSLSFVVLMFVCAGLVFYVDGCGPSKTKTITVHEVDEFGPFIVVNKRIFATEGFKNGEQVVVTYRGPDTGTVLGFHCSTTIIDDTKSAR